LRDGHGRIENGVRGSGALNRPLNNRSVGEAAEVDVLSRMTTFSVQMPLITAACTLPPALQSTFTTF
jgi:hypothetical protein